MKTEGLHVVRPRAAGLDVHRMEITATVRLCEGEGEPVVETRCFSTLPSGLEEMVAWLTGHGCRGTKVVENRGDRWNQAESGGRWRNLKGMRGVVNGGCVAAGGRKSLRIRSGSDRESAGNDDFRGVSGVLKGP